MTVAVIVAAILLGIAAVLLLVRVASGPTVLDRAVALDALVSVTIGAVIVHAIVTRTTTTLPVLVVLTLVSFVGSVSVARFTKGSEDIEEERS